MAWNDDRYVRNLLDARERWGILLSLTAVVGLFLFLWDHSHCSWVKLGPVVIGAIGSFFVFVVDCCYEQAEAIADAKTKEDKKRSKKLKWHAFAGDIRFLGWLHILVPIVLGSLATLTLYYGTPSSIQSISNGDKRMSFDDKIQIWTLVFVGFGAIAALIGAIVALIGVVAARCAVKTFEFNTWLKAQEIYTNPDFYKAREAVLSSWDFGQTYPANIRGYERKNAILVCQRMDELARLEPYLKEEKIIGAWGRPMGKSWLILEKFVIKGEREKDDNKKWTPFEELAGKAIKKYNLELKNKFQNNTNESKQANN